MRFASFAPSRFKDTVFYRQGAKNAKKTNKRTPPIFAPFAPPRFTHKFFHRQATVLIVKGKKGEIQGNRILITEELDEVIIVPGGCQSFYFDAAFDRPILFEQI